MKRSFSVACSCAAALALVATARPAAAYRPFDSTDADVAAKGELELELGPVGYVRSGHKSILAPVQVLNLGFAQGWELVLQGAPVLTANETAHVPAASLGAASTGGATTNRLGIAETQLTTKVVLRPGCLQEKSGISIATEFGAILPTVGTNETGAGAIADVIFSERFSWATFHLNLQGARLRSRDADAFVGLISEGPITWKVRPVSEVFVERNLGGGDRPTETTTSVLVGFIAKMAESYDLDAGGRLAVVGGKEVFEVRAGFSWGLGLW